MESEATNPVTVYYIYPLYRDRKLHLTTSLKVATRWQHEWVKRVVRQAIEVHKELHPDEPVTLKLIRHWWKMFIVYHEIQSLVLSQDDVIKS
jgi:hypothetical protein